VIVAPRFTSLRRFGVDSLEVPLRLMTRQGAPASLVHLDAIIHSSTLRAAPRGGGLNRVNPMAGYYLESFFKQRGYRAIALFDMNDAAALRRAMRTDPLALLFSTTFVTEPAVLVACLRKLRAAAGPTPILVGGQYIDMQAWFLRTDRSNRWKRDLAELGVASSEYLLFHERSDPLLRKCIFIASAQGEHTAARVLQRLEKGRGASEDLADIPNLVLRDSERGWHHSSVWREPVDLDQDYTRWDLIDEMPSAVPIRSVLGCAERCKFCSFRILHPRVVGRGAASIIDEVKLAMARGVAFFNFVDDNVFVTPERARCLCESLVRAELDMVWGAFFNADRVSEVNAEQIVESGFRYGLTGLESGDPRQLERLGKRGDPGARVRGVELLTSLGAIIDCTFLVGFPGESEATLDATAALINSLPTGGAGHACFELFPFTLLSGTEADTPRFRREHDLRGGGSDWSHATMGSSEVVDRYAPHTFRQVDHIPYYHGDIDAPSWWDPKRRDEAFARRTAITHAFMDSRDDAWIQRLFDDLHRLIADPGRRGDPPRWTEILADREGQSTGMIRP